MEKKLIIGILLSTLMCGNLIARIETTRYTDYRATHLNIELRKMQDFHLQQATTKLSNQQFAYAWGDLAYLLCHMPNHHLALQQMITIAPQLNKQTEMREFFNRAVELFPEDAVVHGLYSAFLNQIGDAAGAAEHVTLALQIDPNLSSAYLPENTAITQQ